MLGAMHGDGWRDGVACVAGARGLRDACAYALTYASLCIGLEDVKGA